MLKKEAVLKIIEKMPAKFSIDDVVEHLILLDKKRDNAIEKTKKKQHFQ